MKSIRQQLTLNLLLGLFLVIAVCGGLLYTLIQKTLFGEFDSALLAKARALSALAMRQPAGTVEVEFSDEMMPAFNRPERPDYFEFWYEDGRTLTRSKSLGARDLPRPAHLEKDHHVSDLTLPDGQQGRAVSFIFNPVKDPEDFNKPGGVTGPIRPAPRMILMLAQHRASLDRVLGHMFWLIISVGLFLPLIIALVVWLTIKQGLRPLDRLAQETEAIDSRNLGHRFDEAPMPRELQPIGYRLNALIERLEISFKQIQSAYDRECRFSDNVAHELRTPIAELHSLAEVALMFPRNQAMSENAHHETMAISLEMERLVAALLTLARCESGIEEMNLEVVSLEKVIAKVWTYYEAHAMQRGITFTTAIPARHLVSADLALLNSILNNLLSNAVDHCPAGGAIRITSAEVADGLKVHIANTNDSLTATDLPLVFDRFWQKDNARSSSIHSGLGLALTRSMCQLMSIDLFASLDEKTFLIELLFPHATLPDET